MVVFVSAYEDGAVGAFELDIHAVDYLMKPVSKARIAQALARVVADGGAAGAAAPTGDWPGAGVGIGGAAATRSRSTTAPDCRRA